MWWLWVRMIWQVCWTPGQQTLSTYAKKPKPQRPTEAACFARIEKIFSCSTVRSSCRGESLLDDRAEAVQAAKGHHRAVRISILPLESLNLYTELCRMYGEYPDTKMSNMGSWLLFVVGSGKHIWRTSIFPVSAEGIRLPCELHHGFTSRLRHAQLECSKDAKNAKVHHQCPWTEDDQ